MQFVHLFHDKRNNHPLAIVVANSQRKAIKLFVKAGNLYNADNVSITSFYTLEES